MRSQPRRLSPDRRVPIKPTPPVTSTAPRKFIRLHISPTERVKHDATDLEFKLMLCLPVRWRDSPASAASAAGPICFNFQALGDIVSELGPLREKTNRLTASSPFANTFIAWHQISSNSGLGVLLNFPGGGSPDGIINIIGTLALLACGYLLCETKRASPPWRNGL